MARVWDESVYFTSLHKQDRSCEENTFGLICFEILSVSHDTQLLIFAQTPSLRISRSSARSTALTHSEVEMKK